MTDNLSNSLTKRPWSVFQYKIFSVLNTRVNTSHVPTYTPQNTQITFFDDKNIDSLSFPTTPEGISTKEYYSSLVKDGVGNYIDNISAKFHILQTGKTTLPILVSTENYNDSYVCSEYGHYVLLGLESLFIIQNPVIRKIAAHFLKAIGKIIKKGRINNVIYINHSLFATDLQNDDLSSEQIVNITQFLQQKYPDHAIIFRGINALCTPKLKVRLKNCKYKTIAGRQVQVTDTKNSELYNTRIIKSDMRLWDKNPYEIIEQEQLTNADESRILDLYNMLAIDNHSTLNPRITQNYIKHLKNHHGFKMKALKKDGIIEGIVGYVSKGNVMTCLLFGYDKKQLDAPRLYRLMSTLLLLEAKKHGYIFHQSSGATFYKKIRRATSITEYQAVTTSHLPAQQRCAWSLLRLIMNTIAIPLMKKY